MSADIQIFDRHAVRRHRERAATLPSDLRFLAAEVRERLVDRLNDIRYRFEIALDLGSGDGDLAALLTAIGRDCAVIACDSAFGFARKSRTSLVAEEEALPLAASCVDLVVSNLSLHWTNDLPGALLQLRHILKPDGLLVAGLWGGETLRELRDSLTLAELELGGGAGPRVSPFADVRDAGSLLQRAGFALPVVDSEILTLTYSSMFQLISELRAMGETNALIERNRGVAPRALFMRAAEIYQERFGTSDGRIPASFQLLTLTAWAPAPSQPKPLARGSATRSLGEALATPEEPPPGG